MDPAQRTYHWKPNDTLYFHKKVNERNPTIPSYNEPYYQYRETKLEHVPKPRNNPTWTSSVFSCSSNNPPPPSETQSQKSGVNPPPRQGQTSYQRTFAKEGYPTYSAKKEIPLSPTKLGKNY